ncbi:MAG: hypothetical protein Q8920_02620 [Bacillota bacterium]|nr:hypothetical protein [Bacillota bacterium]
MIYLPEFCTCGSLVINGQCTNKRCSMSSATKPAKSRSAKTGSAKTASKEAKPLRTRKASKCITYNLYDLENKEDNVQ